MSLARDKLLADMLAGQLSTKVDGVPDAARMREVMSGRSQLTPRERTAVLLSPQARLDYLDMRDEHLSSITRTWSNEKIDRVLVAKAAASLSSEMTIKGRDYTVTVFSEDLPTVRWWINIALGPRISKTLGSMVGVRLIDSGGLVWLTGKPTVEGHLSHVWSHEDVSPMERAAQYRLILEPC